MQIEAFLREFTADNSALVSHSVVGKSLEGRDIHMLTITSGTRQGRNLDIAKQPTEQPIDILSDTMHWSELKIHNMANPERDEKCQNK